jgi:eukaryotic-like serine/threonine-protein kinase
MTTTVSYHAPAPDDDPGPGRDGEALLVRYEEVAMAGDLRWHTRYRKLRLLGAGGQGAVYLVRRLGADGFARPVALKAFSPEPYRDARAYAEDMARVGRVAARVAAVQHDNVVHVHDFIDRGGVRLMEMEWLDGFDLREVLSPRMAERSRARLSPEHWQYVCRVILADGPAQPRLQPGVAIAVLRDCLAGLAALHRAGIAHGDLKPANVLLKRSGSAKLIDIGSAVELRGQPPRRTWSPAYAAPEVLEGGENSPRSDLASLGYVLVEMLAGRHPFEGLTTYGELVAAKGALERHLPELLPPEVAGNELLLGLCRRLVAADPARRFAEAQAADVGRQGAAAFHRQLVKGDLASEYGHDLRAWLEQLA